MTVENTWSRRYGKVSTSQNTVVSLVSYVWHLIIPDRASMVGCWNLKMPWYRWFRVYDIWKYVHQGGMVGGPPKYRCRVPTLPSIPIVIREGAVVSKLRVRLSIHGCLLRPPHVFVALILLSSLHVRTWKMTIAWSSSWGWECAATSWLKIYIHSPKIWSRMMEFITRTHKKNRLEFWYILKTM